MQNNHVLVCVNIIFCMRKVQRVGLSELMHLQNNNTIMMAELGHHEVQPPRATPPCLESAYDRYGNANTSWTTLAGRLAVQKPTLRSHRGCVNSLAWNAAGSLLVSGSDDLTVKIWNPHALEASPLLHSYETGFKRNVFSAKFMACNDSKIAACCADGEVRFLHVSDASILTNGAFNCHSDMAFEVFPDPVNPHVFFSSSDDGTVNQYDTRIAESCDCRTSCDRFTIIDVNRSICKHPSARAEISSFNSSATSATKRSVSKTMRPFDPSPPPERRRFFFASSASGTGVSALSIHPVHTNYLAIGSSDDIVRIFDRRVLKPPGNIDWSPSHTDTERGEVYNFLPAKFVEGPETYPDGVRRRPTPPHKITSLKFDPSGFSMDLLVSYSDEKVYIVRPNNGAEYIPPLSDLAFPETRGDIDLVRGFQGHRNRQTMIKEAYWLGPRSQVVMSGSDDGSLVVWDRETGKMINRVKADKSVVNCIAPNPVYHGMVAVSGIDSDVKILRPTLSESWLEKTQATARKQNDHGDDSASEDAEESVDDDEEGNDGLAEEPIRIPRDLLLLYLTRMGVEIGDLLGVGEDSGDQVDGSEGEASQASEGV